MRANQMTRPVLGLAIALGFMGLAAPLVSTSAVAFECTNSGSGGGGAAGASDNGFSNAVACGPGASASVDQSTAVGQNAQVVGASTGGVAVGANTISTGNSVVVGKDSTAQTSGGGDVDRAVAIGAGTHATNNHATAIGSAATASGGDSTATGYLATASQWESTASGAQAMATGSQSSAFGSNATAGYANSAAFGYGATAQYANQQVFGTRSNTYTMAGITSSASTAAQSGQLGLVTTDSNGDLASDPGLYNQIGKNTEGVAMAMALGGFWVPENKKMAFGLNFGSFDGAWAIGGNLGGKVTDNLHLTAGVAISEGGQVGGRVGGLISW